MVWIRRRTAAPAAAPDHGNVLTGTNLGGAKDSAKPCRYGTADEGRLVEWHVLVDLDQGVFVNQHLFGERGKVQELVDLFTAAAETRCLALAAQQFGHLVVAERWTSGGALRAMSTEDRQARDDVVAWLYILHGGPDGFDNTS